ncbi:MAG: S1 RNA-binding domain-containing protein [Ilumatobacteraceae bacterium]
MPQHVIVDGSNLATEGRTLPSLQQLNDAIAAYRSDHPDALITVVVDATFGHRIDTKEVAAFEKAIETNAFVAPPAGAVGRGDGFILSIAAKANATILSNDSYQEFHGEYDWLFDEGRLIGGKPVPHVGWVFVDRVPVRGAVSRRSVKEQKVVDKSPSRGRGRKAADPLPAVSADGPMPVPKSAPPGAVMSTARRGGERRPAATEPRGARAVTADEHKPPGEGRSPAPRSVNDLLTFLSFVEHYPVGTAVTAIVENYSSHGAYVAIGDAKGYVPLRMMADPAPRSAREVMSIGESVTLVVASFGPSRRSIDLAVPAMGPPPPPAVPSRARKAAAAKGARTTPVPATHDVTTSDSVVAALGAIVAMPPAAPYVTLRKSPAQKSPALKSPPLKSPALKSPAQKSPALKSPAQKSPAQKSPAQKSPALKAPVQSAPAKAALANVAPVKAAPAKAARARAAAAKPADSAKSSTSTGQARAGVAATAAAGTNGSGRRRHSNPAG